MNIERKIIESFRKLKRDQIIRENQEKDELNLNSVKTLEKKEFSNVESLGDDSDFYKKVVTKINGFIEGVNLNYNPMQLDRNSNQFKWSGKVNNIDWGFEFGDYENAGLRVTANYDLFTPEVLKALHGLAVYLGGDLATDINNLLELNSDNIEDQPEA